LTESLDIDQFAVRMSTVDVGTVDAKAIREQFDLAQDEMAAVLGTSHSCYKKWEQRTRQPDGAARTLLRIMETEPEAVLRALSADKSSRENQTAAASH